MSDLKTRLQSAVRSVEAPPFLEGRIRSQLNGAPRKRSWTLGLVPIAMSAASVAAIFVAFLVAYQLGHLRMTRNSQESYISHVSNQVGTLMRVGLGDHVHCSYFRKYSEGVPAVEALVGKLGPQYAGLLPIVRQQVPEEYKLMIGHECSYHKRKFIHLSLKNDTNLMSLIIARKADGESFNTEGLMPALVQSGLPIYQAGVQRFQIASFEDGDYLVYFISDFSKEKNTQMLQAMASQIETYLAKHKT